MLGDVGDVGRAVRSAGGAISINSAEATDLDSLPGIRPVTAERIVADGSEGGPFAGIDDMDRVPGIGHATIEALRSVARA